jgi:uncharacterized protein CbrC (UPF0167 family)
MKSQALLFLSSASLLYAGPANFEKSLAPPPSSDWLKPTLDIRARYEFADTDRLDPSHAFTFRERLGLKTQAWNGFSAVIEGEFSQAAIDDYNGGAIGAQPYDPKNSPILDPETNELNQAYVQFAGFDTVTKLGRQKMVYDNAAFIGNVGWRQNEQTFDALSFVNKSLDGFTLSYAYINQVNRIFGSEAKGRLPNVADVAASVNLFNASYTGIKGLTLGGYAYLMDFENLKSWNNNTFGVSAKSVLDDVTLYGEVAWQYKAGRFSDNEAFYAHTTASKTFSGQTLTVGLEHLGEGFKTPLATLHAFNGFSDVINVGRVAGAHDDLTDLYVSHTIPLFYGLKWTNVVHALGKNGVSTSYGWEVDSVLTKKFDEHFTALAKVSHFETEGDTFSTLPKATGLPTTTRLSFELDYTF